MHLLQKITISIFEKLAAVRLVLTTRARTYAPIKLVF
jgi:hypothetical protein